MELKSRNFTSKEPHVAREPQVADPCSRQICNYGEETTELPPIMEETENA
jgi:hypothetical protein